MNCITQVNEPLSCNEHSPSDDDLLDSQEVQQSSPIRAWARIYERKFRSFWKIGKQMAHAYETTW